MSQSQQGIQITSCVNKEIILKQAEFKYLHTTFKYFPHIFSLRMGLDAVSFQLYFLNEL